MGNGDGTLQAPVIYSLNGSADSVASGDLNGDGNLDLAVANFDAKTVNLLWGNGDGTFQVGPSYPAPEPPQSIVIVDLNGDGRADVAVASADPAVFGPAYLTILLGALAPPAEVSLLSSLNPSAFLQPITLSAFVMPASATGTITFTDASTLLGVATLDEGAASLNVSSLTGGLHALHAVYSGDASSAISVSPALMQTVTQID